MSARADRVKPGQQTGAGPRTNKRASMENGDDKASLVIFRNSQGHEIRGGLLRLSRHAAAFEVCSADAVLRTSEILREFKIHSHERIVYSGRAVVRELVNAGTVAVCEANLDDLGFDIAFFSFVAQPDRLRERFDEFVRECVSTSVELPRTMDPLFADREIYSGDAPIDLAQNHDRYLDENEQ